MTTVIEVVINVGPSGVFSSSVSVGVASYTCLRMWIRTRTISVLLSELVGHNMYIAVQHSTP